MSIFYQLSYFLAAALMMAFAGLIYFRRPKEHLVQAFTALVSVVAGWVITLYFYYELYDPFLVLLLGRLNFVFAELIGYCSFIFVYLFPKKLKPISRGTQVLIASAVALIAILTFTTGLVDANEVVKGISRDTEFGPLYLLFPLEFAAFAIASTVLLVYKYRNFEIELRRQIKIFALGWGIAASFGAMTNIILPPLLGNTDIQNLGPVSALILALAMGYAVAKQLLLQVKVLATEFFIAVLMLLFVVNVAIAPTIISQVLGGLSLLFSGLLGVLLIRSVANEVRRREEIQHLATELAATNKRLRVLDDLKTTMVSIASHQIRGPLGGIRGYMSMFRDGDLGPLTDKQKEIVTLNLNVTTRLLNAVETFLDITKLESGNLTLRKEILPLDEAVVEVVEEFKLPMEKKGLAFSLNFDCPRPVLVDMDPEKIKHVIFNLIDNAMKYTEQGSVRARVRSEGHEVIFDVTDTGMGIPPEDVSRLFGKYQRGELVIDRGGSGLGLYVVKMLAEMQGGRVWAASEGVGKGSTFSVGMPLARDFDPSAAPLVQ